MNFKRRHLSLVLICLGLLIGTQSTHASNPSEVRTARSGNGLHLQFQMSAPRMQTTRHQFSAFAGRTFSDWKFKNFELTSEPGKPALPFYALIVTGHPKDLEVFTQTKTTKTFENTCPLPAPGEAYRCGPQAPSRYARMLPDRAAYQMDENRPLAQIDYLGDFRGIPLSRVVVVPARYSDRTNSLAVYPDLEIRIRSKSTRPVYELKKPSDLFFNRSYRQMSNTLLILTPGALKESLRELVSWKRMMGYQVKVVTLEEIGRSTESVRAYIKNLYQSGPQFTHALLIGSEDIFPTHYVKTATSSATPSDLPFFTFGGNGDLIPDVLYGRLVVNSPEDIKVQTQKIIAYEKAHYGSPSRDVAASFGLQHGIQLSSDQGSNPSDEEYGRYIGEAFHKPYGTAFSFLEERHGTGTVANVQQAFSQGAMWVTYIGHGDGHSWPNASSYSTADIAKMPFNEVKPVVIDVACQNGRYKKGWFGERLMNQTRDGKSLGAAAYYGGSVNVAWHPPALMAQGIAEQIPNKSITHLGEALLAGQLFLAENQSHSSGFRDNILQYNLFGDPTMQLRVHRPFPVQVTEENGGLYVRAQRRERAQSLSNIPVTFQSESGQFTTSLTDQTGRVPLPSFSGLLSFLVAPPQYALVTGNLTNGSHQFSRRFASWSDF